jgi:predicted RNA-binding protein with PIN domain
MLWLIDGYNLMYAAGALDSRKIRRELFHRKRRRFLSDLADALGPERCRETTVVLDASTPPADFPLETVHQGLNLIFALGDENADARIETLIAAHSAPKSLTVVSSDRRIRRAAQRRRARTLSADEFLDLLERFQTAKRREMPSQNPATPRSLDRDSPLSAEEAALWLAEFGELDAAPETKEAFGPGSTLLTDAEIARIQREIDSES